MQTMGTRITLMKTQRRIQSHSQIELPRFNRHSPHWSLSNTTATTSNASSPTSRVVDVKLPATDLPLSTETIKFATKLLDQQMWCWGQDVARPKRNALIDYGFQRYAPKLSAGEKAISHYILKSTKDVMADLPFDYTVGLWGSGIYFGEPELGGVYLRRYEFAAVGLRYDCPLENIDCPEELVAHIVKPTSGQLRSLIPLLVHLCRWISGYESWSVGQLGLRHRELCLLDWKKTIVEAQETSAEWRRLADVVHQAVPL
ncbi:MAG: hypothetical protein JWM11_5904 [Planctomycetaceae bacterium]|nr:hypothetical protein [Planctomycetaceae bacterium]